MLTKLTDWQGVRHMKNMALGSVNLLAAESLDKHQPTRKLDKGEMN